MLRKYYIIRHLINQSDIDTMYTVALFDWWDSISPRNNYGQELSWGDRHGPNPG